jgi:DUF1009 family protein
MRFPPPAAKLGIIAGGGTLPGLLIAACRASGQACCVLALTGFADAASLGREPDAWLRLGEAGRGFALFRAAGVDTVVMAGAVRRPSLADLRPDWRTAGFLARIAGRVLGDDGLLQAVIAEIEREGFRVVGPDALLSGIVAKPGVLGRIAPDSAAMHDIAHGIHAARGLGRRDVGQAVVVRDGAVVGEEDAAGTAALIARCGPGGVLVKMSKPQQDRRVDLPAIGAETVAQAAAAGLRGIAVEAGGSLILTPETVAVAADRAGLFVIGVAADE